MSQQYFAKIITHSTWKRKPRWLPTAKSKIFKVHPRPVIPKVESEEMKRLYNNYRTTCKSLRKYFKTVAESNKVVQDPVLLEKTKEDDFLACSAINDEWNKKISVEREERLVQEREAKQERIMLAIEKSKQKKAEQLIIATEEIRKVKELVPTLITSDNIDEVIEALLKSTVDYNYAIDIDGVKYTDTEYNPNQKQTPKGEEQASLENQQSTQKLDEVSQ